MQNLILLIVVGSLVVACAVRYAMDSSSLERALQQRLGESGPLPDRVRKAFDDVMPLKGALERFRNCSKFALFGTTGHPFLAEGRDGFIMWTDPETASSFRRDRLFSCEDLERWRDALQERSDWVNAHGAEYAFVLAPDKFTIYGDKAPSGFRRANQVSRADQLIAYLRQHSTVRVVDLRPVLLEHRNNDLMYYRTDTHWNELGAFWAYREILKTVPPLDQTDPLQLADFRRIEKQFDFGDTLKVAGVHSFVRDVEPFLVPLTQPAFRVCAESTLKKLPDLDSYAVPHVVDPIVTERSDSTLPRLLVFQDSFGVALQRYLSHNASRAKYVWHADVNPEDVERERPDVVIQEMTERYLLTSHLRASRLRGVPNLKLFDLADEKVPTLFNNVKLEGNRLSTFGSDPHIVVLGGFQTKTDKLLDLDLETPEAIRTIVHWSTLKEPDFSEWRSMNLFPQPGRHLLRFALPPEAYNFRITFGNYSSRYRLRSFRLYDVK